MDQEGLDFDDYLKEQLRDPELARYFREACERTETELARIKGAEMRRDGGHPRD